MSEVTVKGSSFPILGLLGLIFVTLKLCKIIDWSWWWVTLPFWGIPAIAAVIAIVVGLVYLAAFLMDEHAKHKRRLRNQLPR